MLHVSAVRIRPLPILMLLVSLAGVTQSSRARTPAQGQTQSQNPSQAQSENPSQAQSQSPSQAQSESPSQAQSQSPSQAQSQSPSQARGQSPSQAQSQSPSQAQSQGRSRSRSQKLVGYDPAGGVGKKLFEIPIDGTIDLGLAPFVERVVEMAGKDDVVVLRLKTFGGRIDAAVRIRDALLNTKAKTITYIDHEAASAGALISLASDTIIMKPGSAIGAATPVDEAGKVGSEKVVSYFRELMRATAEAKGRRGDLAAAMVDQDVEVKGVNPKGKVLTLTAERAVELGLASALAPTYDEGLALLNLGQAERHAMQTHWGEKVARWLTDPVVSSLLMSFGVLGLLIEFYTGGHGLGGAVGLLCLGLFFFGQYTAHLAGWEEVLIFGIGFVLLLVEIFIVPGFGVTGILGLAAMGAALVMSLVELNLPFAISYDLGYLQEGLEQASIRVAAVLVAMLAGTIVFGRYLPQTSFGRQLILAVSDDAKTGFVGTAESTYSALVGKTGHAVGMLRPAGIAEFEGARVDVVSEGDYVEAGTAVRVVQVEGNRVVVKRVT